MALTNKLTAIANAIRAKTGKSAALSLDDMATEIADIPSGGGYLYSGEWCVDDLDTVDKGPMGKFDVERPANLMSVKWVAPKNVDSISWGDILNHWSATYSYSYSNNRYGWDSVPPQEPQIDSISQNIGISKIFNYKGNSSTLRQRLYYHDDPVYGHFLTRKIGVVSIPSNIQYIYPAATCSGAQDLANNVFVTLSYPILMFENEQQLPTFVNVTGIYGSASTYTYGNFRQFSKITFLCKSRTQYDNCLAPYRATNNIIWKVRHSLTALSVSVKETLPVNATSEQMLNGINITYNAPYLDFDNSATNLSLVHISDSDGSTVGNGTFKLVDSISGVESNTFTLTFAEPVSDQYIKISFGEDELLAAGATENYINNNCTKPTATSESVDGHPVYTVDYSIKSASLTGHSLIKIKILGHSTNSVKLYYKVANTSYVKVSLFDVGVTPSYANWTNYSASRGEDLKASTVYQSIDIPSTTSLFEEKVFYIDVGYTNYTWIARGFYFYFDSDVILEQEET